MSGQCPLGFKGQMPAAHPPVPGMFRTAAPSVSWLDSLRLDWKDWLAFSLDGLFVLLVLLALAYPKRMAFTHARKGVPTIAGALPIIGNTLWILRCSSGKDKLLDAILRVQRDELDRADGKGNFPLTATFPALGGRITVLNHPLYIAHVQKTNFENYIKGSIFRHAMSDVLGLHGIFVADGDVWKRQRKMASHIFSVANFNSHIQNTVHHDLGKLDKLLGALAANGRRVELQDLFFRFTLDTFTTMAFSADIDCLPTDPAALEKSVEFAVAFDSTQGIMDNRFFDPLRGVLEYLPWNAQGRKMRDSIRRLNRFCYATIDKRIEAREKGTGGGAEKGGKDLLELFIQQGLSREELLPVVLNFIIAGRDTTAQTLAWLFWELASKPDVVAKLRAEADEVLGVGDEARPMNYDDLKQMPYTHATFYEASRLHPAVPKNAKQVVADDVIRPYGPGSQELLAALPELKHRLPDVVVKKGESVVFSDYVMARLPEIWGADCLEFKPERFLEEKDGRRSIKTFSPFIFHSFNAGPRLCLGQTLATYEGAAVTAQILRRFDVVYDHEKLRAQPPVYADSLTHPIDPAFVYHVSFKPRA